MKERELEEILAIGLESRHREFKASMSWDDPETKGKVTKSILAMSNIRDGGILILGINRLTHGGYDPVGVSATHLGTFDPDEISRYMQDYADPSAVFTVERVTARGTEFLVIRVQEFEELPVICRKSGPSGLTRGAVYTRTHVPETLPVPGESEMRELIQLAVDKGMRRLIQRLDDMGIMKSVSEAMHSSDKELFEAELGDLVR